MEQRSLFAGAGSVPVFEFVHSGGRLLRMSVKTGEVFDSDGDFTPQELESARIIRADYASGWNGFSFVIRSALHKEIRRGDVAAAVRWGRLFERSDGKSKVRAYIKNIIFEETRNLSLQLLWKGARGFDSELMVRQITASVKKWEIPSRARCFDAYVLAYVRALAVRGVPTIEEMRAVLATQDLDSMYELFWRVRLNQDKGLMEKFDDEIRDVLAEKGGHRYASEYATGWTFQLYATKTAIEMAAGSLVDESVFANVDVPVSDSPGVIRIPELHNYVYDNHTRPGLPRVIKSLRHIRPGQPMINNLDFRWTGMVRGVAWRTYAFQQFGAAYVNVPWEAVAIPDEIWKATVYADAYFYGTLYQKARIVGVPLPKQEQ